MEAESRMVGTRAPGGWGVIFNGYGVSVWGDEKVQEMDGGVGRTTV